MNSLCIAMDFNETIIDEIIINKINIMYKQGASTV